MVKTQTFFVAEQKRKLRLDQFLFEQIGTLSRMYIRDLLAGNAVSVNEQQCPGGYHLHQGDCVRATFDEQAETAMSPENLSLEIVYEDDDLLVVNKAAGMLVHPTKRVKTGTLANALAFHLNFAAPDRAEQIIGGLGNAPNPQSEIRNPQLIRPGLVHRLDKNTSGLLVVAKTGRAHRILSSHFERKLIEKQYLAVVAGKLETDAGEIFAPIGRTEIKPHWRVLESGKSAHTRFRVVERRQAATLLELEPVTGRTNQLRVHLAHIGHPIVGDENYGGAQFSRLCLHAARLAFFHPSGGWREFIAAAPPEFDAVI